VTTLLDQLVQSIILGLIQGITEWLPISSTAHLKIAETFLGLVVTPLFNLVLHLGTLTVLIYYFRSEIKDLLRSMVRFDFKSENGLLIPRILIATVLTATIGLVYSIFPQDSLGNLPIIAVTFLVGGTIVYSTKFSKENTEQITFKTAILLGIAQGFAIFPGLSRSGITISAALLLGLKREKALKFSFLLSIPAIIGNFVFEIYRQHGLLSTSTIDIANVVVALVVTMISGYFAIRVVSQAVRGKKLHYFAGYTWSLGTSLILLMLFFWSTQL
jgi:undecaprenyl-diphosphatase